MLRELEVRDLGIIDHVRLEFPAGFSVLSGETGAGKSLLVQSLQLLAGERADSEQVRGGCDRLLVQGRFETPRDAGAREVLGELGAGAGDEVVLRREVSVQGRSRAWVDDVAVTVGTLQRLAPRLLSIHGQHEQRGLADPSSHLALVDLAGGLGALREEVGGLFAAWQALAGELAGRRHALASRRDRLDVIAFQVAEIEAARVEAGEDEALREERALLRHAGRIGELLATATAALGGEEGSTALARAARAVGELAALGVGVAEPAEQLEQAAILAQEAERELGELTDRVRVDPARLEAVEARLAELERLALKYGGDLPAVEDHLRALREEQRQLASAEVDVGRLELEVDAARRRFAERALELSARRVPAAAAFAGAVVGVLERLGMPSVRLELRLARRPEGAEEVEIGGVVAGAAADGIDTGEFLVSANPGEEPRPLARIASGGELSRIHLAIRTVLREGQGGGDVLTLLFDEVDAGIGGRVADELGELLADLGRRDQVLVVTHLPQVAGRASAQFVVHKEVLDGRTVTRVDGAEGESRVEELVRMLGGGDSAAARQHARELLRRP